MPGSEPCEATEQQAAAEARKTVGTAVRTPTSEKARKRRDGDPVKVYSDNRISYWTSGVPGEGKRVFTRPAPGQHPDELAAQIRHDLGTPSLDKGGRSLLHLLGAYLEVHDLDSSTTQKYRSAWNNHILPLVGGVRCRDLSLGDLLEVVDASIDKGHKPNTVTGVVTAFRAVVTWGIARNWFGHQHPFGSPEAIRDAVNEAMRAQFDHQLHEEPDEYYTVETVPTHEMVEQLAVELDKWFEGASHYIRVLAASGMRIAEFVALRVEDIDLELLIIRARRQGRRNRRWSATAPGQGDGVWTKRLKGRRRRDIQVWEAARESLEWLAEHAVDGWLVPPDNGQAWWLDSINRRINNACAKLGWPKKQRCHWLRHYYGTYSIAAAPVGYGLDTVDVSRWLGHRNVSVTQNMYQHSTDGAAHRARKVTARRLK